jgi:hypothetical protein
MHESSKKSAPLASLKLHLSPPSVQLSQTLLLLTDPVSGQPHRSQVVRREILAAHLKSALPGALGWLPRGGLRDELSPEDLGEVQQILSRRKSTGLAKSSSASGGSPRPKWKREGNEHDKVEREEKGKLGSQTVGGAEDGEVGGQLLGLASRGLTGSEGISDGACSGGFELFSDASPIGADVERDPLFVLKELDGKRRWFDNREGKLAGKLEGSGGFVLVTDLQPCTEFRVRTWKDARLEGRKPPMASEEDNDSGKIKSFTKEEHIDKMWESPTGNKSEDGTAGCNSPSVQEKGELERGLGESFVKEGTEVTLRAGRLPMGERPFPHAFTV